MMIAPMNPQGSKGVPPPHALHSNFGAKGVSTSPSSHQSPLTTSEVRRSSTAKKDHRVSSKAIPVHCSAAVSVPSLNFKFIVLSNSTTPKCMGGVVAHLD